MSHIEHAWEVGVCILVTRQKNCPDAWECVWSYQLLNGYFEKHIGKSQQEPDFCVLNVPALLQRKTGEKKRKEKQHHCPAGILARLQLTLCFSSSFPPEPCYKWWELGTTKMNMKHGCSIFSPLTLGRAFVKIILLGWEHVFLIETQNILILMTLGVCLPSVGGKRRERWAPGGR